jgi:hypothetical protein
VLWQENAHTNTAKEVIDNTRQVFSEKGSLIGKDWFD